MSKHNVARMVAHSSRSAISSRRRGALLMSAASFALAISWPTSAFAQAETALPSGGTVVGGTATIGTPSNAQLQINQSSDRAIITWDSFDIGSSAGVTFSQPSASAIALNRVVGGSAPSQIAGQLNSNGIIAVINSNGVMFAGTANVNVGGLIASAADVGDDAFMAGGALSFTGSPSSMSEIVVSAGASISIADQGLGLFFAPVVRNAGVINARLGQVTLASGTSATLDLDGTGFLEIGLGNESALVSNSGTISAGGGRIHMTAKAASAVIDQVVNTGILSVASATSDPDGTIILSAQSGNAVLGGSLDVGAVGSASVLAANEVKVESAVAATGNLSLTGRHISGAGDINVTDGALALTLDVAGADTSGEGNFIGDALGVIGTVSGGVRLDLGAGTYAAGATIFHNDLTIDGGGVATIFVPINGSQINGLNVNADGATITGLTFASALPQGVKAWEHNWGSSFARGIAIANGADGATISDNNMSGLRQAILVDGRGTNTLSITGNLIDNTKSAILLQYVDGSAPGFDISGNMQGAYGNEWGINLHLNGVWDGTNLTSGTGVLGANTSLENQARLLALSAANGGMAVLDQGYTASNRTHVSVSATGSSSGQGAANTPLDTVQAGINAVVTGGKVMVGAGSYAEAVTIAKGLTLTGAGMDETAITGGIALSGTFSDLILKDFAVSGSSGTAVIQGGQVTNLTLDGIRIDGGSVSGRHGMASGKYGGALSITNSEFLNIRGWAAFDTRSGAGTATDGTQITSAVFSNNLLDNTAGHIAFRQQAGEFTYPDITVANNIVRNGGDSDTSFGAIFKAFRANKVDFTGNVVSDVGLSTSAPSGEAVYGAVLITRTVGTLNVTGNSFTNNHQVFAIEPGYALPTVTNFTDNSFVNNGYAIYLPANVSGAGTINFSGTNNFVAGDDTVQHIVWRSAGALDLTGVSFNGVRADALDLAGLFAAEDLITHAIDVSGAGLARLVNGQLFVTSASGTGSAARGVALATAGERVNLSAGTHVLSNTLNLNNSVTLAGQGQGVTILDASGHNAYGIRVKASDVTLSGFTLNGKPDATGSAGYGIKVESGGDSAARNNGFTIRDVTINNSRKTGLDLNAAVDALIDNVTVTGVTAGNGITIIDSANVTVRNSRTSGNAWGGVALYQANSLNGGSDQQLTGITIEANNDFAEANGLYLQDSSTLHDVGTLNIQGYGFTVRNEAHRNDGAQFTFFQKTQQGAFDFGVNLASSDASVVQGWSSTAGDANFYVGFGSLTGGGSAALSLQTAVDKSSDGAIIHVGSGTYGLSNTLNVNNSVTLAGQGQGVTILDASGHNAYGIRVKASDVTLSGFTLNGKPSATGNAGYGIKVEANGDVSPRNSGFTIRDVTINSSRKNGLDINAATGALIDNVMVTGVAAGSGIAITDSANVTIRNSSTSGNAWGGVALYQTNNPNGSDQQLTGITIEANNDFAEASGLYVQDSSTLHDVGTLNIQGYGFTVRNAAHRNDGAQFTFFQKTQQDAFDYGVNLALSDASVVQGWTGTSGDANFYVGFGALTGGGTAALSLQTAFDKSADGAVIHVASGNYGQSASLTGARGLDFEDVTLDSLTLSGSGSSLRGNLALTGAGFIADAALLLNGDSSITALAGNISLAGVTGDAALLLSGNAVTLGQSSLASLGITGAQISTANVTTSGAQSYNGATSLSGSYAASEFSVSGSTVLAGSTSVTALGGNISLAGVTGDAALLLSGNAVTLGQSSLASLGITGAQISTANVTTSGAQSYNGATSLSGTYAASDFAVAGSTGLAGSTSVTAAGAARFVAVDGTSAGGQSFALVAGTAELGALGSQTRLGATRISANQTVLGGALYSADSLSFIGTGSDASVRVTQALTRFDTRAVGGDVSVAGNLIGTTAGAQSVEILTGTGLAGGGDILLANIGSEAVRLGSLRVVGGDFSAATVKLAGNFDSALSGNQMFTDNTLDTLGNVSAVVKGSESGPIRAGGSVAVDAGSGNGSITAGGPVQLSYISDVVRDVSSQSSVSVASSGSVGGSIAAAGPVAIASGGGISSNVTAGGGVNMTAATGDIVGAINARGPVSVGATQGSISSSISTTGSASLAAGGGISSAIKAGGSVAVTAPGAITSSISSGGSTQLTSDTPINVVLNGGSVTVNAPGGTVGGVFGEISTSNGGSFVVNDQPVVGSGQINARQIIVDTFLAPVGGTVGASGEIILPAGYALGLIAPAGGQRPTMFVNNVESLGELLRRGYTAIIIQIDESGLELEREASEAI